MWKSCGFPQVNPGFSHLRRELAVNTHMHKFENNEKVTVLRHRKIKTTADRNCSKKLQNYGKYVAELKGGWCDAKKTL